MRKLLFVLLFLLAPVVCFAGYDVTVNTEDLGYGHKYNWHVYNVDQGEQYKVYPGLDGFFVLVPSNLVVTSYSVPPAPHGYGEWTLRQDVFNSIESLRGTVIVPAPPTGKKWLRFWGSSEGSIYALGMTAHFSITTTKDFVPGQTQCVQTTYALNPDYISFQSATVGPTTPVPEPSSLAALGIGAMCLGFRFRRR